jgi:hypothetical protein
MAARGPRTKPPADLLKDLANASGGSRTLARAIARGGFATLEEAVQATLDAAVSYVEDEGPVQLDSIWVLLKNRRRSWAIHLTETGRYITLAINPPGPAPRTLSARELKQLVVEARQAIGPVLKVCRTFANPAAGVQGAEREHPDAVRRLRAAGLLDELHLPAHQLAARVVHHEHPEAGAVTTIERRAKSRG